MNIEQPPSFSSCRLFANTLLKDYLTYDEYRWAVSTVMTSPIM